MPRIVKHVAWTDEDAATLVDALRGHRGALGENAKGKDIVGRHFERLANSTEVYSPQDILDLIEVYGSLIELWLPETDPEVWRANGAPGGDDAVEGLALERARAVERAELARAVAFVALGMVQR